MSEAVILAGGFGTRLRDTVPDVPKSMAPIAGKPFIDLLLTMLSHKGFERIIMSVGHKAREIVNHLGNRFAGMELTYEIEPSPLGTGGAVRRALASCEGDHAFVFNGDTFLDLEVSDAEALWQEKLAPIIVALHVPDATRYGCMNVEDGQILGFMEKKEQSGGLINAGSYIFPTNVLDHFPEGHPFSLEKDYLSKAVGQKEFLAFVSKGYFIDIGIPEDYRRAQLELPRICNNLASVPSRAGGLR